MFSGGTPLARRQQNFPAGERYLANQRLASSQLTPPGGPPPVALNSSNSPRQHVLQSPMQNYHPAHGVQRVDMGQAMDPQESLKRRQGSPFREPSLTASRQAPPTTPTIIARSCSASFPSGSSASFPILDSSTQRMNPSGSSASFAILDSSLK